MPPRCPLPLLLILGACAPDPSPAADPFDPRVRTIHFEIDATDGVVPKGASGTALAGPWELLEVNTNALFDGTRTIELPAADDVGALGPATAEYDGDDLLALAAAHRDAPEADDTAVYHVLFVDGYWLEDGERNEQVLGVSIGDTGVIGMFVPVIGEGPLARFVEQTTLVHELGHAVGLVDNGVAMATPHEDGEHAHHCDDDACVMYWLNEGAADLREYVQQYVVAGDVVLFDDACLADAHAAAE